MPVNPGESSYAEGIFNNVLSQLKLVNNHDLKPFSWKNSPQSEHPSTCFHTPVGKIEIDVSSGELLIGSVSSGLLPDSITDDATYLSLFGKARISVEREVTHFVTKRKHDGANYHFAFCSNKHVYILEKWDEVDLIALPYFETIFGVDLMQVMCESHVLAECSAWYSREDLIILLRENKDISVPLPKRSVRFVMVLDGSKTTGRVHKIESNATHSLELLLALRHSGGVGELLAGNILPITQILPRPPRDNEAATSSEDETSNLSVLESVLSKFDQPKYMHFFVKSKFISTGGGDNNKHDLTLAGVELIRFGLRFNIRHNVNNKLYQLVADSFSGWCLASCQQMNDHLLGFSRYFLLENSMN
jgi:hypothetical protein